MSCQFWRMVADPPYGVGYDPSWRARRNLSSGRLAQGKVLNDDRADWQEAYGLFPGDVAYVWHGALHGDVVAAGLAACGFQLRAQIVWAKPHFVWGRGDVHWKRRNKVRQLPQTRSGTGSRQRHRAN